MIGMPENLRMHWVWPSKYKGKWCFSPKCGFSETDHHTALKFVPLWLAHLKTVSMHWVWPSKYKGKWCFSPKCGFSETGHHTPLLLVPLWLAHLKMSACTEFGPLPLLLLPLRLACLKTSTGPLNTKESDVLAQNVVSLKQVIIHLYYLYHYDHCGTPENSGCTEFGPLNTKESDVFAQNVVSNKQIIIQLWNCTIVIGTPENFRCTEFGPLNTKESDVLAQNVVSLKQVIIQLYYLYHYDWHTWKSQDALSLAL